MTTTQNLREYLDAHGVDGAPTEPGWFMVCWTDPAGVEHISVVELAEYCDRLCAWSGGRFEECMKYTDCIVRHAPLNLAPPATPR